MAYAVICFAVLSGIPAAVILALDFVIILSGVGDDGEGR